MSLLRGSLDANVVLRLLLKDVPEHHAQARMLLSAGRFTVDRVALAEVCFVLGRHYGLDRSQRVEALRGFIALPGIVVDTAVVGPALELFLERPALSFEDCLLVTTAQVRERGPLWTFDRKLAGQTPARLVGPLSDES